MVRRQVLGDGGPSASETALDWIATSAADDPVILSVIDLNAVDSPMADRRALRASARSGIPAVLVPVGWQAADAPVTVAIADDGSSDGALSFGAADASRKGVPLRLVHSWLLRTPSISASRAFLPTPDRVVAQHRGILSRATERATLCFPNLVIHEEIRRDTRSAALLEFAPRSSLIVVGAHDRGLLTGSLFESVIDEILWRSRCPLAIVPASHPEVRAR